MHQIPEQYVRLFKTKLDPLFKQKWSHLEGYAWTYLSWLNPIRRDLSIILIKNKRYLPKVKSSNFCIIPSIQTCIGVEIGLQMSYI